VHTLFVASNLEATIPDTLLQTILTKIVTATMARRNITISEVVILFPSFRAITGLAHTTRVQIHQLASVLTVSAGLFEAAISQFLLMACITVDTAAIAR